MKTVCLGAPQAFPPPLYSKGTFVAPTHDTSETRNSETRDRQRGARQRDAHAARRSEMCDTDNRQRSHSPVNGACEDATAPAPSAWAPCATRRATARGVYFALARGAPRGVLARTLDAARAHRHRLLRRFRTLLDIAAHKLLQAATVVPRGAATAKVLELAHIGAHQANTAFPAVLRAEASQLSLLGGAAMLAAPVGGGSSARACSLTTHTHTRPSSAAPPRGLQG